MTSLARGDVIAVMRRVGMYDRIDAAKKELPEVIDLDRDHKLLDHMGLSRSGLIDQLGGSP
jgi:hypothetical protein